MASTMRDSTPDTIKTTINYYQRPSDGGPHDYYVVRTAASRRRPYDSRRVRVFDLRGREGDFNLNKNGFQLARHVSKEKTFDNEERVKAIYHPEIERLMKEQTGATHVFIFSQIIRRHSREDELALLKNARDDDMIDLETPAMFAHIDQSYAGAPNILETVIENNPSAAYLSKIRENSHRFAIVNAWRPLKPITREPLAVCDAATVSESDLREITLVLRDNNNQVPQPAVRNQKLWQVAANPQHRWYWPKRQTPEEVLLIKCFDSKTDVARRTPHTAIQTPEDCGPPRESIEIRCFLFWENDDDDEKRKGEKARL